MKPVIGITASCDATGNLYQLAEAYTSSIKQAGGVPLIIPPVFDCPYIPELVDTLDGLVLSGGADLDPHYFGQEPEQGLGRIEPVRDEFELALADNFFKAEIPILAICRGMQVLNVARGGTIIQDLSSRQGVLKHYQDAPRFWATHGVEIKAGSLLSVCLGGALSVRVNSFHHQAVADVAPDFIISARSRDGIIEGIEGKNHPFALGVQWHPETMREFAPLFEALVKAAEKRRRVK